MEAHNENNKIFGSLPHHGGSLDQESVHHIRKGTKQLRARLQLLRRLEGEQEETERLRESVKELARMLAGQRDTDVMHNLLQELIEETGDPELSDLLVELRDNLVSERLPEGDIKRIRKLVSEIEKSTHKLLKDDYSESDINRVLEERLSALCGAGRILLASSDWEALHDWRKQVKKLMYQYELKASPTPRDLYVYDHLDQLGGALGRINDLSMLKKYVRNQESANTRASTLLLFGKIFDMIEDRRQSQLAQCREVFKNLNNPL